MQTPFSFHPENEWSGGWTIDHLTSTKLPIPTPAFLYMTRSEKGRTDNERVGFKRNLCIKCETEKIKREAQIEENIEKEMRNKDFALLHFSPPLSTLSSSVSKPTLVSVQQCKTLLKYTGAPISVFVGFRTTRLKLGRPSFF